MKAFIKPFKNIWVNNREYNKFLCVTNTGGNKYFSTEGLQAKIKSHLYIYFIWFSIMYSTWLTIALILISNWHFAICDLPGFPVGSTLLYWHKLSINITKVGVCFYIHLMMEHTDFLTYYHSYSVLLKEYAHSLLFMQKQASNIHKRQTTNFMSYF